MLRQSDLQAHIAVYKSATYTESKLSKLSSELRQYANAITCAGAACDQYYLKAIESVVATQSLFTLQNAGAFRYSVSNPQIIIELARLMLRCKDDLLLSPRDIQFLEGVPQIKKIYDLEILLTESLVRELKKADNICKYHGVQCSFILTLCAYVENLIVAQSLAPTYFDFSEEIRDKQKNILNDYSLEDIVSALGLVVSIYNDIPGLSDLPDFVFADNVITKRTEKILLIACRIRYLQEMQTAHEHFGYQCTYDNNTLLLKATDANSRLLQDYRLSHIKRFLSSGNYQSTQKHISFSEVIESLESLVKQEKCEDPPRFRLYIPEPIFEKLCEVGELTQEEHDLISYEIDEMNLNPAFLNQPIYQSLTLLDYIRLRRFFLIFFHVQVVPLYKKYEAGEITQSEYLQSLIPCVSIDTFKCLRPIFGDKLDAFWELNNYQGTNSSIIDLQYQPVIPSSSNYYVLSSIATISNIGRNLFTLLKRCNSNINEDGTDDPLLKILSTTFANAGILFAKDINIPGVTDIDFAYVVDKTLFIAECKKNIVPTDIFEARTSIDAIHKAERQLRRIQNELRTPAKLERVLNIVGVDYSPDYNVVLFVITGNRVFSNTNEYAFPIRHFRDLIRYVESGTMKVGEKEIYFREGPGFAERDFLYFLQDNSPYLDCFIKSMAKYSQAFNHTKLNIQVDDYVLECAALERYCQNAWGVSPLNSDLWKEKGGPMDIACLSEKDSNTSK